MTNPVILFDGDCNLCDGFVQFVIKRDASKQFRFASLQSTVGRAILKQHSLPEDRITTMVLSDENRYWLKSDAALGILAHLSGAWRMAGLLKVIPTFLRNAVYDLVAASRYRLFGRKDACLMPTKELNERFLA